MSFNNTDIMTAMYIGYLGRAPDLDGLNYWLNKISEGMSLQDIATYFSSLSVSKNVAPGIDITNTPAVEAFVKNVYSDFLGREAEPAGVQYWANKISSGEVDPNNLVFNFINGVLGDDYTTLSNKISFAKAYTYIDDFANFESDFSGEVLGDINHTKSSLTEAFNAIEEKFTPEAEIIEKVVEVIKYVSGGTTIVEVEVLPDSVLTYEYDAVLHKSGTIVGSIGFDSLLIGSNIPADGFQIVTNETFGSEMGMVVGYRTGKFVDGIQEGDGVVRYIAHAGEQVVRHELDVDVPNANYSAASFNFTINEGVGSLTDGPNSNYFLLIDTDKTTGTDFFEFDLSGVYLPGNDGVFQASWNFGFDFIRDLFTGDNAYSAGDIGVGEYHVVLQNRSDSGDVLSELTAIIDLQDLSTVGTTSVAELF